MSRFVSLALLATVLAIPFHAPAVMALAARPVGAGQEIWTGTVNGKLFVLNGDGKIIGRGHLPGPIDHLAVAKHGAVLATTSGGEVALYGGR